MKTSIKKKSNNKLLENNYYNHYNYYNKNSIKMNKLKRKDFDEYVKEKQSRNRNLHLPKMLYSNFYIGSPCFSVDNSEIKSKTYNINKDIIDNPIPYSNTKYDKKDIKEAINLNTKEEKFQSSHVGKPLMLFDDILNCVDNLEIEDKDKEEYNLNNNNDNNDNNNNNKEQNLNNSKTIDQDKNILITINKDSNDNNKTHIKHISYETLPKMKMSLATNLTDDSVVQKVLEERRNYKQILKLNEYGKYKYSKQGVNYPDKIQENKLPKYKGKDKNENEYFNYLKKASNPKKIYNDIGTFNEKFNYELARISHSYGKEESKGRFLRNPLIDRYQNTIPYYDIYKDIKFVENRYLDKGRYKYKMLPLVMTKMRNFDRLGQKIYQMNIQKRNGELVLQSIGLDKNKLAK